MYPLRNSGYINISPAPINLLEVSGYALVKENYVELVIRAGPTDNRLWINKDSPELYQYNTTKVVYILHHCLIIAG